MSDTDTPDYEREPNANGLWQVDHDDNRHVEQVEELERGVYFVGYWTDGRAIIYDSGIHSVHLEVVHADQVVRNTEQSDTRRVRGPHIERWVRKNRHQIAALHPRYYWILEVNADD